MSYCPATTSITILSLCNFCLQSNKRLLNSLHSLEICSTYICAKCCFEMLSTQIFHTGGIPGWELTGQHIQTPTVGCGVTNAKNYGLNLRAAIAYDNDRSSPTQPYIHRTVHTHPPTCIIEPRSREGSLEAPSPLSTGKEPILCVFSGASPVNKP